MDNIIPRLDRSHFSVISLADADNDSAYWLSKHYIERLNAIEINRVMVYGETKTSSRLQRFFEVAELSRS